VDKRELRTHYCDLRECRPAGDIAADSRALCERLSRFLPPASCILTYLAFRNEPDLSALFDLLPEARWIVPRIAEGRRLALHPYDPGRLVRHRFGMLEPAAGLPVVDPAALDVALVPGVAFDQRGGRLGFGGGYYDRFLPTTPALRVGIAFDQCLAEELPCVEYDQRMDWLATPSQMIHCAPLWREECNLP
jgi:5-formyltetrahydrofolate cyclo-ligase